METHVLAGGRSLPEKTLELYKAAEEAVEFWFERPFEQWIVGNQDIERQKLWRGNLTNSVTAVVRKHRKINGPVIVSQYAKTALGSHLHVADFQLFTT